MRQQIGARFLMLAVAVLVVATACGDSDGSGSGDSDSDGTGNEAGYLAESLPTVDQLETAADCSELNRRMAGVENENFLVNSERTAAEEEAGAPDAYDTAFDAYYQTFSGRQGDLGCSDAEMGAVLDIARQERCEAWLADGHHQDEDPLLLNTASCQ